ncbi:MAG: hypothetical protein DRJ40_03325 [Thermoprotei archaeon]|nr:MAG: hypothetical protein DRJ40_03325 [Thermoprotei archaeon]
MKPIEVVVAEVITEVELRKLSLRGVMEDYFSRYRELSVIKGVVRAFALAVLRNFKLLDYIASNVLGVERVGGVLLRNILRATIYEVLFRNVDVSRVSRVLPYLSKIGIKLRDLLKVRDVDVNSMISRIGDVVERLSIKYSQPTWVVKYLLNLLGDAECERLLARFNEPATLWIRVNTTKVSRRRLMRLLAKRGVETIEDPDLPDVLRVVKYGINLSHVPEYHRGYFHIQDKASALVTHVLSPKRKSYVVDLCAAPGGKSTHIAQITRCRCTLLSLDWSRKRLQALRNVSERLGVSHGILPILCDSRYISFRRKFDYVLVDPDCSSLGKLGHSPEIRLWITPDIVRKHREMQMQLLLRGIELLKTGGVLVYSTCTFTLEENEVLLKEILESRDDVELVEAEPKIGLPGLYGLSTAQRLYPHIHDTTGFFIAKLRKIK